MDAGKNDQDFTFGGTDKYSWLCLLHLCALLAAGKSHLNALAQSCAYAECDCSAPGREMVRVSPSIRPDIAEMCLPTPFV